MTDFPAAYPDENIASQHSPALALSYLESGTLMLANKTIGMFDDEALQKVLRQHNVASTRVVLPRKTFGGTAFAGEKALMHPVAFNMRRNRHGDTFIRLPEELDGSMCYGNVVLSILESAGYALHWAPIRAAPFAISRSYKACVHGSHSSRGAFVAVLIEYELLIHCTTQFNGFCSYLKRTQKLRESGLERVYSA